MGKTYTIGKRCAPVALLQHHVAQPVAQQEAQAQEYWVCTKALALALQGSRHFNTNRGTCYGVFSTRKQAQQFLDARKLRLVASVVAV